MTRWHALRTTAAALVLALLFAFPVGAQLPGRQSTPTPVLDDGGWITLGILQRHEDTGALRLLPVAAEAPTATHTPQPPTATRTPTPSATVTPTNTPTATATPGQGEPPTPTPEQGTPPPTFTETPVPKACVLKNDASVTNIRSAPTTGTNNIVNKWQPGVESVFTAFTTAEGYLWGRMADGWAVVRSGDDWWVYGTQGSELCDEVPGWPVGLEPPAAIVASPLTGDTLAGLHFSWFSDHAKAAQTAPLVGMAKCLTLTGSMCDTMRAANPAIVTIYRDYRSECPSRDQVYTDAAGYYARLRALWAENPGFDYYEIMNECSAFHGQDDYAALAQFSIDVATLAAADGYCILALSSYPGAPELAEFVQLEPYLRFADSHPCGTWPSGAPKYHGIATHATGYCPASVDTSAYPWVGWSWVAGRHLLYAEALAQTRGYDVGAKRWPWVQTEWGLTYGQDEDSGAFEAWELRACIRETVRVLSDQGVIDGFTVWNYGRVGDWLDCTGYLPGMFQ